MKVKHAILVLPIIVSAISLIMFAKSSYALDVTIEDNASGSQNNVNIDQQNQTTINQNNTANINNNVNVNCDTGANQANNNTGTNTTIGTGDCQSNISIQNQANLNTVKLDCPDCLTPSPSPEAQRVSPSPSVQNGQPGNGGPSGNGGGNGGNGSGGSGQALAATGIFDNLIMAFGGFILISLGLWQTQNVLSKRELKA